MPKATATTEEAPFKEGAGVLPVEETSVVTDEMKEAARASAQAATLRRQEEKKAAGVGTLRRRGGSSKTADLEVSDIPYPAHIHGEDFEEYGATGAAAFIPDGTEISPYTTEQEFVIEPTRITHLMFTKPGANLPKKRLYTVKAIHKDGRIVQLPFEPQVQNNAGGDPEDIIGLMRYERKGILLLIDKETMQTVYCAAWDCWAQAATSGNFINFCSLRHAQHTLPNRYKDANAILAGFGDNATTSRTWSA